MDDLEYPRPKPPCEECRAPFGFPHRDGCNGQFWQDIVGGPRRSLEEAQYPAARRRAADADPPAVTDGDVAALRAEILTGWWEVDEPGRDQALARLDRIEARLAATDKLRAAVDLVRHADRRLVEGLRAATARGEGFTVDLCAPGTRDLAELLDALLALSPPHRCLAVREWQPPRGTDA